MIEIPNAIQSKNQLTGGQPSLEQFKELKNQGYEVIVNLRGEGENPSPKEQEIQLKEMGFESYHLPIEGAAGLSRENVESFDKILRQIESKKTLIHCGSGNRVGALFALRAFWLQNQSEEEALKIGKQNGLTGLFDAVQNILRSEP